MGQYAHISKNLKTRLAKVHQLAKEQGLIVDGSGVIIGFTKPDGGRHVVSGIWCAETFLEGYVFANTQTKMTQQRLGRWKDEDLKSDDDWENW